MKLNEFGYRLFSEKKETYEGLEDNFRGLFHIGNIDYILGHGKEIELRLFNILEGGKYHPISVNSGGNLYYDPITEEELKTSHQLIEPITAKMKELEIETKIYEKEVSEWNELFDICYKLEKTKKKDLQNELLDMSIDVMTSKDLSDLTTYRNHKISAAFILKIVDEMFEVMSPIRSKKKWIRIAFNKFKEERYKSLIEEQKELI